MGRFAALQLASHIFGVGMRFLMLKFLFICTAIISATLPSDVFAANPVVRRPVPGHSTVQNPVKYISSCEIDLNNDNVPDIAMLIETSRGRELIVLMKQTEGYTAYQVSKDCPNMILSCHKGSSVTETAAGSRNALSKTYKTPGAYLMLKLPESSSAAYYWNGTAFTEVWTSD